MTPAAFRKLALSLPNAMEQMHMGHPDFRVQGKIFATLDYPAPGYATVMLSPFDQGHFVTAHADAFKPVKGKWGELGATTVTLKAVTPSAAKAALRAAYDTRLAKSRKGRPGSAAKKSA